MNRIDFTNCKIDPLKMYGGANGNKIGILYQDTAYMLKFPPKKGKPDKMQYINSCISEYIACSIFSSLQMEVQETLLGTYQNKSVVACKDFETEGFLFKEFAALKNTVIISEQNGYGTELEDILLTIDQQQLLPPARIKRFFWEMFIGDTLLGNFDRHNGNWGFLINAKKGEVKLAPIFDCGSCLYPQADEAVQKKILSDVEEMDQRIYAFPNSAIYHAGAKINYFQFLSETDNAECLEALRDISERIDMKVIEQIIYSTPYISEVSKEFISTMVRERKNKIMHYALKHNLNMSNIRPVIRSKKR
ncbi:MAG: HipA domain-containing protein [Dysgonomonas sp.]